MAVGDHYVIFSGANERAIVACCRDLSRHGLPFSIIARPTHDKISLTAYRKNIARYRTQDALNAEDMLAQIAALRAQYPDKRLLFVPTAESVNRLILLHRARFSAAGLTITLCAASLYLTLSDKSTCNALAHSFGIKTPEPIAMPDESQLPLVAKPVTEFSRLSGKKLYPQLLFTAAHIADFNQRYRNENYFYQRFIDGKSYYLLMFVDRSVVKCLWQRNLLQQAEGKSIIAAEICACPDPQFESSAIAMLQSTGFSGFIMIEMMQEQGISFLIEANPRLWGPLQLALDQGFTLRWLGLSGIYPDALPRRRKYFWLGGLLWNRAERKPVRHFGDPGNLLRRFIQGEIYSQRDTAFLFVKECSAAFKHYLKKQGARSESLTARID